jgi:cellulose synthase/poly-beta-1,6-N-acetylglucosamine synthase-like glycosyltransferase
MDLGSIVARVQNGQFICKGLPESWCERGRERFTLDAKGMEREMRQVPERFVRHWGSAMFALLPLYALLLKLVYWKRRMRWSEHLVFALHLHAFIFAMVIVQLASIEWVHGLAILAMPVYSVIALQKVYGGRWWATTLRVMTLGFLYFVAMVTAMAFVAIWAFLT